MSGKRSRKKKATQILHPDRIVGLERVRAGDLLEHPKNWRLHGEDQADILTECLGEFGIVKPLVAYHSERHEGRLTLLDGHGRRDLNPDQIWPVLITDLVDSEADTLLMLLDPIGTLANPDSMKLLQGAANADTDNAILLAFCADLAMEAQPKERGSGDGWRTLSLRMPADLFQQWLLVLHQHGLGNDTKAFEYLLSQSGPLEGSWDEETQSWGIPPQIQDDDLWASLEIPR